MKIIKTFYIIFCAVFIIACSPKIAKFDKSMVVYKSKSLIIKQVTPNVYIHTTYLQTESFGNVPCNGMIVTNNNEAIVFDTPTNDENSEELIQWINEKQHCKINAVVSTHFHQDCLGGLQAFYNDNIPAYAYYKTIEFAKTNNFRVPNNAFQNKIALAVGADSVMVAFYGEGHTKDNVVAYFPKDEVLFGGCLIKALDANKGYLGDASVQDWSATVEKVKKAYPNVKIVIPGHGKYGNTKLLDYTINLFRE